MNQQESDVFLVEGHQIKGYELLKRKVSRANSSSGRVVLPATWIGATVKVILGGEIYDDYVRPGGNQGRLNVKIKYHQTEATIIRTSE